MMMYGNIDDMWVLRIILILAKKFTVKDEFFLNHDLAYY